ncbi:DUF7606 domain-containing protein [Necropsobacter rosorum]|uniref:ACP-like domain-containing protein n=1 Tax=Necropsobacter rosorum TaxID=908285 RepID=UPI00068FF81A
MKFISSLALIGLSVALAGCDDKPQQAPAAPQDAPKAQVQEAPKAEQPAQQTVTKTVEYACGADSNEPVIVTYRFEGQEPVAADVVFKGQNVSASGFMRDTNDQESARFISADKFVWVADNFTLDNVDKVNGNMLYVDGKESDEILVKYCATPKSVK